MDQDIIRIERPSGPSVEPPVSDIGGESEVSEGEGASSDSQKPSSRRRWVTGVVAVVVAGLLAYGWTDRGSDAPPAPSTVVTTTQPPPALSVGVFETILPSTVTITADAAGSPSEDSADDDAGAARTGLGTGVIVSADGVVLTALHVVAESSEIEVRFADGAVTTAQLVDADPENDIAVLLLDGLPSVIVPAVLGNPGALRIGEEAYVVGNPVGLVASMSAGVISGLDRSSRAIGSDVVIDGLIQFDAAVNPGNSGGPLLNRRGEVVGIVTGLVNPSGAESFSGIGFAATITAAGGGLAPGQ